jgi:IS1 family transposase/transposase-like protein
MNEIDYTKFACPNPVCSLHGQFAQGNIRYRSLTGKNRDILRLKCRNCGKEFSERKYTLMERSHLSQAVMERILKCFRWGVCNQGTAEICGVNVKTIKDYRKKTAEHGQKLHDEKVKDLSDPALQNDEVHSKIRKTGAKWIAAAIACRSLLIVAFVCGERNQALANHLLAKALSRFKKVPMILTDGWQPYVVAIALMLGQLYRVCGKRSQRLRCRWVQYAQVVKKRDKNGLLLGVSLRCMMGDALSCCKYFIGYNLGKVIHTIHIERWFASLRSCVRNFYRRTRYLPWKEQTQVNSIWLYVTFYNWFIPHSTLCSRSKKLCTPAMAAGLTTTIMTYQQFIWLRLFPVKENIKEKELWNKANDPERIKAYKRSPYSKGKPIDKEAMIAMTC